MVRMATMERVSAGRDRKTTGQSQRTATGCRDDLRTAGGFARQFDVKLTLRRVVQDILLADRLHVAGHPPADVRPIEKPDTDLWGIVKDMAIFRIGS